ncbi:unnamed protein product [Paramecium sonneborni]|uniref:Uncharacterized protein n=1 Tax=Paramecium sonneborni TaxID=65129 RepID=A0A8S1QWG8_9CILI|nr:unnamed protein product [Paramecium sonneborni]
MKIQIINDTLCFQQLSIHFQQCQFSIIFYKLHQIQISMTEQKGYESKKRNE